MGVLVLVLGESGTGKSASLRNFKKGEVCVLNVGNKPLPFKNNLDVVKSNYSVISTMIKAREFKSYVIDDSQFLMLYENAARANENGWNKYKEIASKFMNMLVFLAQETPDDTIVYLLHHPDFDENGHYMAKAPGKMVHENINPESQAIITLLTKVVDNKYIFVTNGTIPAKTPLGMFKDIEIENDLKLVDKTIREYYGMKEKS